MYSKSCLHCANGKQNRLPPIYCRNLLNFDVHLSRNQCLFLTRRRNKISTLNVLFESSIAFYCYSWRLNSKHKLSHFFLSPTVNQWIEEREFSMTHVRTHVDKKEFFTPVTDDENAVAMGRKHNRTAPTA